MLIMCQLISVCGPVSIPINSVSVFLTYVSKNGAEVFGAFEKLRKANINFVMVVFPPVSLSFCL